MPIEQTLRNWTEPSSNSEQEKQNRTERMIKDAINNHESFNNCSINVFAKGSYANNTNVRVDSDVDIAVECTEVEYWEEEEPGIYSGGIPYNGPWTPEKLRVELEASLENKFPSQIDLSGSTAIKIKSNSSRVDADVVPCFTYKYYMNNQQFRKGTKIFDKRGRTIVNYPEQQLANGRNKNSRTGYNFKKAIRVLKRIENAMVEDNFHEEVPSYFIECLVYNCPDHFFIIDSWTETLRVLLAHMRDYLDVPEPISDFDRWLEVNECFYLFHNGQKWTRNDASNFVNSAWRYLEF